MQFDNDGNAQVKRYGRAITGNTPMMVEEQGRWIYKPSSQSWVRGSPDDLVAVMRSCDAITTYERSIAEGTIEHQLSRVATSIYWTVLTLKGAFNEAFDRPGDDPMGACEPVS